MGVTDCAFTCFLLILFKISKFNSNKASSTILIVFSSVTLKPFIKFDSIFCSSSFFFIFLPPPWITIEDKPNLKDWNESVIRIFGNVVERSKETKNYKIATGEIELKIQSFAILSKSDILPLPVNSDVEYSEDFRLKYRYLDLRRPKIHNNIDGFLR